MGSDPVYLTLFIQDKTESLAMPHDTFSRNTRAQIKQVFDALRELMTPAHPPTWPIRFITPEDKPKGSKTVLMVIQNYQPGFSY